MKRKKCLPLLLLCLFIFSNCYHYKMGVDKPYATDYSEKKVDMYFWGLKKEKIKINNCQDQYLQEVYVYTHFGQSLFNVLTLGIWKRVTVKWKCGKERPIIETTGVTNTEEQN